MSGVGTVNVVLALPFIALPRHLLWLTKGDDGSFRILARKIERKNSFSFYL
jgi:hypothetical protein